MSPPSWAVERGCEPTEEEIRERLRGVPLRSDSGTPTKTDLLRLIGLDHLTGARRRRAVVVIQRVWPEVLLARLYEWAEDERCRARQEADEHQREVARLAEEVAGRADEVSDLRVALATARDSRDRWGQVAALLGVVVVLASVLAGLASLGVW